MNGVQHVTRKLEVLTLPSAKIPSSSFPTKIPVPDVVDSNIAGLANGLSGYLNVAEHAPVGKEDDFCTELKENFHNFNPSTKHALMWIHLLEKPNGSNTFVGTQEMARNVIVRSSHSTLAKMRDFIERTKFDSMLKIPISATLDKAAMESECTYTLLDGGWSDGVLRIPCDDSSDFAKPLKLQTVLGKAPRKRLVRKASNYGSPYKASPLKQSNSEKRTPRKLPNNSQLWF